jgi:hypothetical protein
MGKMISRTAAAKILGCTNQTITNYIEKGLLDVSIHAQKGRQGFFFDEDQVRALAPNLRELDEINDAIERGKATLKQQLAELTLAQEEARKAMLRAAGGQATWKHLCSVVAGAYAFVDKVSPGAKDQFELKVLTMLLSFSSIEDIAEKTGASVFKVKKAVMAIAKRMMLIPTLTSRYNAIEKELETTKAENARLKELMEFKANGERITLLSEGKPRGIEAVWPVERLKNTTLEYIGLSMKTVRYLNAGGIHTLYDLVTTKETALWDIKGITMNRAEDIVAILQMGGLNLGMRF